MLRTTGSNRTNQRTARKTDHLVYVTSLKDMYSLQQASSESETTALQRPHKLAALLSAYVSLQPSSTSRPFVFTTLTTAASV